MRGRPTLWFIVLACAASQANVTAAQIPMPAYAANNTVPFDLYGGYLIVAHGSAGRLKNLNFLVDTGTSVPIFDSRIAEKLHLSPDGSANIVIVGGRARGANAILPSLEFGPIRRSNLEIVTTDLSFFQRMLPVPIDAIVGLDVLGEQAFVIDYRAQVIRFGPGPALAFSVPLKLNGGLATFDAEIDHVHVHLAFDTGVHSLVLFDPAMTAGPKVRAGARLEAVRETNDVGNFQSQATRLQTVTLGDAEFRQRSAILVSNPKQSQLDFDGLMSPPALGISRVSVDIEGGVLEFSL